MDNKKSFCLIPSRTEKHIRIWKNPELQVYKKKSVTKLNVNKLIEQWNPDSRMFLGKDWLSRYLVMCSQYNSLSYNFENWSSVGNICIHLSRLGPKDSNLTKKALRMQTFSFPLGTGELQVFSTKMRSSLHHPAMMEMDVYVLRFHWFIKLGLRLTIKKRVFFCSLWGGSF